LLLNVTPGSRSVLTNFDDLIGIENKVHRTLQWVIYSVRMGRKTGDAGHARR
jgi:hypothetical protein